MERRHTFSHLKCLSLKLHTLRAAIPLLCASPELQITMKRVSSLHLMSQIPTPQATTFRRHKRGASPVYSFPAKPLSLIQAPLPCSKLLETHCAGCSPLSVCMTGKLSHSNLQHDARLTFKTEMFCPKHPKTSCFFSICAFLSCARDGPRAFRFHFVLLRKC